MTDREKEKVLHGLSSCGNDYGIPNICEVTECPYREGEVACVHNLAREAMMLISELLKEQEPRVMTLEEAQALDENSVVWFENKRIHSIYPRIVRTACSTGVEFSDGAVWTYKSDGYNTDWRYWTEKPTDEQREAEAWK